MKLLLTVTLKHLNDIYSLRGNHWISIEDTRELEDHKLKRPHNMCEYSMRFLLQWLMRMYWNTLHNFNYFNKYLVKLSSFILQLLFIVFCQLLQCLLLRLVHLVKLLLIVLKRKEIGVVCRCVDLSVRYNKWVFAFLK